MITIDRGPEPPELARERPRQLARAVLAWRAWQAETNDTRPSVNEKSPKELKRAAFAKLLDDRESYACNGAVMDALHREQGEQCAFCDGWRRREGAPIEHFRARKAVYREPGSLGPLRETDGYWWLTWSWENLLFTCEGCNGQSLKGNRFPIAAGGPRLVELEFDLSKEDALLIDPTRRNPMQHIIWAPEDPSVAEQSWIWQPTSSDDYGKKTIEILGLRRLSTAVSEHIRDHVLPRVRELRSAAPGASADVVWDRVRELFAKRALFRAAAWDALCWWVAGGGVPRASKALTPPGRPLRAYGVAGGLPPPNAGEGEDAWLRRLALGGP